MSVKETTVKKKAVSKKRVSRKPSNKLEELVAESCALQLEVKQFQSEIAKREELLKAIDDKLLVLMVAEKVDLFQTDVGRAKLTPKEVGVVDDWDKFYAYVKRKNAFELLQRRLNNSAWKERLEHKEFVPGVKPFKFNKVDVSPLKKR